MLELDKDTFEAEVLQSNGKILVDFYSGLCDPCLAIMPLLKTVQTNTATKSSLQNSTPWPPAVLPLVKKS